MKRSALQCYDCQNVTDVNACNKTVTCASNEACFMGSTLLTNIERTYTLTCKDNIHCNPLGPSSALVGRSVANDESSSIKRVVACHECCATPLCNKALCNHPRPATCTDDQSVDCAKIHSLFNVCADIQKAKLVCPKFCNLCNVVDGNWNWWSSWSRCDVTCANGTLTRHRNCTDPAPQNGGLDCFGIGTESQMCILDRCPVHGGWSLWSPWGSCSVTCDVGMQRRDRSCSNPYPSKDGDHCYGDSRDDQICYEHGCTNGGWSAWANWSSCTATCGGGLRTRDRMCNNPFPSYLGRYCDGSSQNIDLCNNVPCSDGGWSAWENWSSCTATCAGGLRTRDRMCNNPVPSYLGRYCDGPSQNTDLCNNVPCTGTDIQFVVGTPVMTSCSGNSWTIPRTCEVAFDTFISRANPQFNLQRATFTASKTGTYWFEWNLVAETTHQDFYIYKNDNQIAMMKFDSNHTHVTYANQVQLMMNDYVRLKRCAGGMFVGNLNLHYSSTFTGILIS
ncbi:coadhesin-like isoform X3 [Dreissena polymorpha]|uniref:coadhesin-like isoform X3 n=1 Tax=Dreissena polymorpha TaxID=45954 RepID=UPI00226443CA|nr:coadhesin-like isoform X3 [Dreissena polymorpha]